MTSVTAAKLTFRRFTKNVTDPVIPEVSARALAQPSRVLLGTVGRPATIAALNQDVNAWSMEDDRNETENIGPVHQFVKVPENAVFLEQRKEIKRCLNYDDEVTIANDRESKFRQDVSTSIVSFSEKDNVLQKNQSIGDSGGVGSGLVTIPSQAVFSFVHDERMVPDSSKGDGPQLRKLTSSSNSRMNICEITTSNKERAHSARVSSCWIMLLTLMLLIISLKLFVIVLLVNRIAYLEREISKTSGQEMPAHPNWLQWVWVIWEDFMTFLTSDI
ncbi:uncharacterized protein LOC131431421 [Malaya genurostris]|uniref:uncharacterized protein LOC131431421 n=1 Tax=Malaya genurostris TaxID=325434 RepID=UPI0026F3E31F|nr:uncharacterized protein LOC131431421 [Malaya genurostris]